ncbi:hypothetical protein IFM89_009419, partial [Coptis chinensis]
LSNELRKWDDKLRADEILLENKNLEIKKLKNEKKEALAAQFAAKATLRRVHANQKDEGFVPVDALIAPLEAEIKIYKNEMVQEKPMEDCVKAGCYAANVIIQSCYACNQIVLSFYPKFWIVLRNPSPKFWIRLAPEILEDLYHLIKKAIAIRKHLERNRKDNDCKFRLILVESRIHRLFYLVL